MLWGEIFCYHGDFGSIWIAKRKGFAPSFGRCGHFSVHMECKSCGFRVWFSSLNSVTKKGGVRIISISNFNSIFFGSGQPVAGNWVSEKCTPFFADVILDGTEVTIILGPFGIQILRISTRTFVVTFVSGRFGFENTMVSRRVFVITVILSAYGL